MSTEIRVQVGLRLKSERERLGLGQAEMAGLGDVRPRTYQDWERGISSVSMEFLVSMAGKIDAAYVLTGVSAFVRLSEDETALLRAYAGADEAARAALRLLAERVGGNVPAGRK
jgi:transcriptional regulator with XRE-family HTH domain